MPTDPAKRRAELEARQQALEAEWSQLLADAPPDYDRRLANLMRRYDRLLVQMDALDVGSKTP